MNDQKIFPQSYLAMENGDLVQVQDFKITTSNKGKQVHTQRRTGAGVVKGKTETTITFNSVIDEDGIERNYLRFVQKGTIKQIRAKCPGGLVLTVNGMFTTCDIDGPLEDATKVSCTFIGKLDDQ